MHFQEAKMENLKFYVDQNAPKTRFDHYWEKCVGSCHAYTALREDYRMMLRKAKKDLGFQYVRFHGIFNDQMSVVREVEPGKYEYNFVNIDNILDFLLSIDMKPFLELSFMPTPFASGDQTCFYYKGNVTMPKSFELWDGLIVELLKHLESRYGIEEMEKWFFEVWNEPDLDFFFAGSQEDYFLLYEHTARAVKSAGKNLKVGGPATANNEWIPDLISYCEKNSVPLDFISTHHYPSDDPNWNADMHLDNFFGEEVSLNSEEIDRRGLLTKMVRIAKHEAGNLPLYYTEWNTSANEGDEFHDTPYSSALVTKTLIDNYGYVEAYSFWTFSDIFEEHGQVPGEFRGGFGLQTIHGIPKPVYRAFELMHELGEERLPKVEEQGHVGICPVMDEEGRLAILAYNQEMSGKPISQEKVEIHIKNASGTKAVIQRIDDTHANAKKQWEEMGCPTYPLPVEVQKLKEDSELKTEELPVKVEGEEVVLEFELPVYGVALIKLM